MMRRGCLLVTVAAGLVLGCSDDASKPEENPYPANLAEPAQLLEQLRICYELRDIERYRELLDPEFLFIFAEDDVTPDNPGGTWNGDLDAAATECLFSWSEVAAIRLNLTASAPEAGFTSNNVEARRIRVSALLDVDIDGGETTLRVDSASQDFYFRRGSAEQGTDPERWYLLEWVEPGPSFRKPVPEVAPTTWGRIKGLCR